MDMGEMTGLGRGAGRAARGMMTGLVIAGLMLPGLAFGQDAPATDAPATMAPADQAPATQAPAAQAPSDATQAPAAQPDMPQADAPRAPVADPPVAGTVPNVDAPTIEAPMPDNPALPADAPAAAAPAGDAPAAAAPAAASPVVQDEPVIGAPRPAGFDFQPASTSIAREQHGLDRMILYIITAIVLLVSALLLYAAWRFNEKRNPVPAKFTHNSPLEIAWTLVPILILVVIGSFSLPVLFNQVEQPKGDINLKITGNQWYWSYDYTDDNVAFDSFLLPKDKLVQAGYDPADYLLATDTQVVLPVNKIVAVTITGSDVIHAWFIPAFGVMHSAVPGRLGEFWFKPEKEGIYFGQCTNICGKEHAYMPITVKVVSQEAYDAWLAKAKVDYAADAGPVKERQPAPIAEAPVKLAAN